MSLEHEETEDDLFVLVFVLDHVLSLLSIHE